jgi:hypothetical protein
MSRSVPRRDRCFLAARRAARLTDHEAQIAWRALVNHLEELSEKDVPKFNDLFRAIRRATTKARSMNQ